ncbi:outer membrane protein OmpA-like peptidoglycan-associated protein [Nonomuraea muscovyensis]|uniref:Outer membrane protein OmpA-like peptidoglycan-associated protein n=1 Tax=Nonomuraea muscovyensis TaxID=1124761 RepID=A0A7X0F1I9_9ACTN|nr:OmpA family protein [Nonomuraea muscovyensis]MBB6352038.1 outer membrane protein OmpA-like peptidoglycan-associated protein [Nonomuraea muscovyensis]
MWHKTLTATSVALALAVTGCGVVPLPSAADPATRPPSAAPTPTPSGPATTAPPSSAPPATPAADSGPALAVTHSTETPTYKIEVVGLNRVEGAHLLVRLRLSNTGEKDLPWSADLQDNFARNGAFVWASGIGVLDAQARRWLMPYQRGEECLCTHQDRDGLKYFIEPGASIGVYAVVPAPSGNPATATVVTPAAPPLVNVPISDDPPAMEMPDLSGVTPVRHLVATPSEALDKSEETADDGRQLQVSLSSDVLFAVDKANLTGRARTVLARTAKLVDASSGTTVEIAGHADSTGTDAINDPLSRRRAEAVRKALAGLVSRDGLRFTAQGYGSRRPLYSNDEEEGRRRNRRVTVTFAKPRQAAPPPTAAASPSTSPGEATAAAPGPTVSARSEGQPFTAEITGLRRLPGGLGVLTYRLTNRGEREAWHHRLNWSSEWMSYRYQAASNVRLTDQAERRQYLPGRIEVAGDDGPVTYCACTEMAGVRLSTGKFAPGEAREFWSLFGLPATASRLTVKISDFPATEVAVTG